MSSQVETRVGRAVAAEPANGLASNNVGVVAQFRYSNEKSIGVYNLVTMLVEQEDAETGGAFIVRAKTLDLSLEN